MPPEEEMWRWTVSPESAPDQAEELTLTFERGDVVAIDGHRLSPAEVLAKLNERGGANGIGRADIVENRYVGMKSRGCYETPGGSILLRAHRAIESITLDREVAHLKDELMPRYAEADIQRILVVSRAPCSAGRDRPDPVCCQRRCARCSVQGERDCNGQAVGRLSL